MQSVKIYEFDSQVNTDNYVYDNLVRIVDIFPIFALMRTSSIGCTWEGCVSVGNAKNHGYGKDFFSDSNRQDYGFRI